MGKPAPARNSRRERSRSQAPGSLIDSALFGHEKGAYTGALTLELGRFELADGGTILQEGEFERVGSAQTRAVDVRVIAATNRDLHQLMREGQFRPDLYFRLAIFPVEVAPLRARPEDIPLLVWRLIYKKQARLGKRIEEIPQTTMDRLTQYPSGR